MADTEDKTPEEQLPGYVAPAKATVDELMNKDADDESLQAYKASLGLDGKVQPFDASNPAKIILQEVALLFPGRDPLLLDPKGDSKSNTIVMKEGEGFNTRIRFYVQHEIVSGLKYENAVKKMGVTVNREKIMMGSFAPKTEVVEYIGPIDEVPSGMLARGSYNGQIKMSDDDGEVYADFTYSSKISKGWE